MTEKRTPTAAELSSFRREIDDKAAWLTAQLAGSTPFSEENPPESEAVALQRRSWLVGLLHTLHEFSLDFNARTYDCGVGAKGRSVLREPLTKAREPLERESGYLSRLLRKGGRSLTHYEHVVRVARRAVRENMQISDEELAAIRAMSAKFGWKPV